LRSPNHPDERDLDVAALRRSTPQATSPQRGLGGRRGKTGIMRYLVGGLVVLVLALFSGVVWFAYQDLVVGGDEPPPVIRADATPIKREPDERGGLPLVNEESVVVQALEEPDSPVRVERILPREAAAPRSTADVIPEELEAEPVSDTDLAVAGAALEQAAQTTVIDAEGPGDSLDTLLAEIVDGEGGSRAIEPAAGPAPVPAAAAVDVPALEDDLPMPADGVVLPDSGIAAVEPLPADQPLSAAPAPVVAAPETPPAPAPALAPVVATPATPPAPAPAPVATQAAPPTPAPAPVVATPATPPAPVAPTPAETTVAALPSPALAQGFTGAYGVQLLAARDEAAVAGAWADLQRQHPSVLGSLRSRVQRAEIGGNTFYRLQAGPFADRGGASGVCAALQARGTDCFIVEPTS